ncbi:MAG: response regulator transcription factor [Myxococcaceae bacterium]
MPGSFHILVIEDHSLFAEALDGVLRQLAPRAEVHHAPSAEDGVTALLARRFALVLLDLGLPGLKGRAAFDAVKKGAGETPVVILSGQEPSPEVLDLIRAGARGFVSKRAKRDELLSVLRFVLDGGTHVPPSLVGVRSAADEESQLTPRQREVLVLLARGQSNKDIANTLNISEATVRVHVSSVMRLLGVENRTQAATSALARRLAESS